jgi:tRNA(fMet)-specific endonuclease VapC
VKYLLDSDSFSFIARESSQTLLDRVLAVSYDDLAISVISRGEIEFGLSAHAPKRRTIERSMALLGLIVTLPLTAETAFKYRDLRVYLQKRGTPIGGNDAWIAAHALTQGLTIVTNNEREFRRVPGLTVETWTR